MVLPVNMQLAHWNLEHAAQQQTRDPAAAAAQAARQGEGLTAAEHRDVAVQNMEASAEEERLGRKKRREEKEKEGKRRGGGKKEKEEEEGGGKERMLPASLSGNSNLDLYA